MDLTAGVAISLHLFLNGDYNSIHPYAQLEQNNWAAGAYYNSEKNISMYVSKTLELYKDYELEIGAVTGYDYYGLVVPMVRIKKDNFFLAPVAEKWDGKDNFGLVLGYQF